MPRCTPNRLGVARVAAFAFTAALLLAPGLATAGDLYTFFDGACQATTGVLVHVDDEAVVTIDLAGQHTRTPRSGIHAIVLHQPLENPIPVLNVDERLRDHLRDVWLGDDSEPSFTGWATSFFDDLLIFADVHGKTHVLDPGDIRKLKRSSIATGRVATRVHADPKLGFPSEIVPCSSKASDIGGLPPSRVIADRIKLGDYFSKLEERYRALAGFEERTHVYAQPFVFDKDSRVGLIYHQGLKLPIPFYFRWSSGRPYRFQSLTLVGNATHEWLPFVLPTFSVRSDVKSHFFNATFVGNLISLPAGDDAFRVDQLSDEPLVRRLGVEFSYNYLIMMGADYWRLSASAGPAYLATKLIGPSQSNRVAQADKLSPAVRLRYQATNLSLRALYFRTRMSGNLDDVLEGDAPAGSSYDLEADIVRIGASFSILPEILITADQIFTRGRYRESMHITPLSLSYFYAESSVIVSADFGRYVTVKGYGRLLVRHHDVDEPVTIDEDNRSDMQFGGALEFVF